MSYKREPILSDEGINPMRGFDKSGLNIPSYCEGYREGAKFARAFYENVIIQVAAVQRTPRFRESAKMGDTVLLVED